jgi:hypothetical protein
MTQTFKVGDKVAHRSFGAGEIAFGPYADASGTGNYVMKQEGGVHYVVSAGNLSLVAKFNVGDKVRSYGDDYTVLAGPFRGYTEWYVVEDEDGKAMSATADDLTAVESTNTYAHDGVVYDLDARYRDRGGDVWAFTGNRLDGVPTVTMYGNLDNRDTVVYIADTYGPLTRV